MKNNFNLTKKDNIILYGAAAIGKLFHDILKTNGFNVIGYIDKRADEILERDGLPVWKIEEIPMDKDPIVIISIKNVFEQDKIAKLILNQGCNKIIYRPKLVLQGSLDEELIKINKAYDNIIELKEKIDYAKLEEIFNIPLTKDIKLFDFKDNAVISRDNENNVLAYIPMELIYTAQQQKNINYPWAEKNIMSLLPHIFLYEYFDGKSEDYTEFYVDFCMYGANGMNVKATERWKKNLISNRHMVYNEMCKSQEIESDFFVRAAPEGLWNSEMGYFNLNGGRHRAAFFAHKGYKLMPLLLSNENYNKYINEKVLKQVIDYIEINDVEEFVVPVPHPYFYRFPVIKYQYFITVISQITRYISEEMLKEKNVINFNNIKALIATDDDGALARHFMKLGSSVSVFGKEEGVEKLLNKLFYVNNIKYLENKLEDLYDIIYLNIDILEEKPYLKNILNKIKAKKIFIEYSESNKNLINEINLIKDMEYKQILKTYWNEDKIEVGVYSFE